MNAHRIERRYNDFRGMEDSLFLSRVVCIALCSTISVEEVEQILEILPPRPKLYLQMLHNLAYNFVTDSNQAITYEQYYHVLYKWNKDESRDWLDLVVASCLRSILPLLKERNHKIHKLLNVRGKKKYFSLLKKFQIHLPLNQRIC